MSDRRPAERTVAPLLTPARKALVLRAMDLVKQRARYFARRYAGLVELEVLEAEGKIGVLEAAHRYEEGPERSFERYAWKFIDGRMWGVVRCDATAKRIEREAWRAHGVMKEAGLTAPYNLITDGPEVLESRLLSHAEGRLAALFAGGVQQAALEEELEARREYAAAIEVLREAIGQVPEAERDVLEAMLVDGMDMHEVAALLGVSYATVRRRVDRAVASLQKHLKARGVVRAPPARDVPGVGPVLRSLKSRRGAVEPAGA